MCSSLETLFLSLLIVDRPLTTPQFQLLVEYLIESDLDPLDPGAINTIIDDPSSGGDYFSEMLSLHARGHVDICDRLLVNVF